MMGFITSILIVTAFLGASAFVFGYQRWANWRVTVMGRHVMSFMAVVMTLLGLAVVGVVLGREWLYRDVVRLSAYSALNWVLWWRFYLLWKVQHVKKKEAKSDKDSVQ